MTRFQFQTYFQIEILSCSWFTQTPHTRTVWHQTDSFSRHCVTLKFSLYFCNLTWNEPAFQQTLSKPLSDLPLLLMSELGFCLSNHHLLSVYQCKEEDRVCFKCTLNSSCQRYRWRLEVHLQGNFPFSPRVTNFPGISPQSIMCWLSQTRYTQTMLSW
jgi:hypothetical protein